MGKVGQGIWASQANGLAVGVCTHVCVLDQLADICLRGLDKTGKR